MTTWKKFVWNLCKFIKNKKKKKKITCTAHKYSQPLLNTLLKHLRHQLQPQIFLGMMRQALIIIIESVGGAKQAAMLKRALMIFCEGGAYPHTIAS